MLLAHLTQPVLRALQSTHTIIITAINHNLQLWIFTRQLCIFRCHIRIPIRVRPVLKHVLIAHVPHRTFHIQRFLHGLLIQIRGNQITRAGVIHTIIRPFHIQSTHFFCFFIFSLISCCIKRSHIFNLRSTHKLLLLAVTRKHWSHLALNKRIPLRRRDIRQQSIRDTTQQLTLQHQMFASTSAATSLQSTAIRTSGKIQRIVIHRTIGTRFIVRHHIQVTTLVAAHRTHHRRIVVA
mmetsp:Transcript_48130/g.79776  ORF Transcript_48130/g.79776 Transcript_48130/m.79776 type:complete len:237 (-) Transcript_48130:939-1649(-)